MLIFCMLLALSGTTDFPGTPHEIAAPPTAPGLSHSGVGEAMASVVPLPADTQRHAGPGGEGKTGAGVLGNRPLLILGFVFVAVWVFLSFRLLSKSRT